jgi:hypothetical protein
VCLRLSRIPAIVLSQAQGGTYEKGDTDAFQEMAFTEAYIGLMCPPVILIGCILVVRTIGIAGLVGIGVSRHPLPYSLFADAQVIALIAPTQCRSSFCSL